MDLPPWLLSLLLAPFGLILGSFGNVLIHRLPLEAKEDRNVVTKPSHCPSCKTRIRWFQNIPLLSWVFLRGRCASCGWRIPFRYPLVEALSALLFAISPWVLPFGTLIWFKGLLCGYALIVLFFTDFTEFMLPDVLQFPLMVLGVLFTIPQLFWGTHSSAIVLEGWHRASVLTFQNGLQTAPAWTLPSPDAVDWLSSLLGLALGYGGPWLINAVYKLLRKQDGLGMGDFKLLAWLGAFWGWQTMLGILAGGTVLGAAVGIPLLLMGRAKGRSMMPFGCFLAVATPVMVYFGRALWLGYLGMMR